MPSSWSSEAMPHDFFPLTRILITAIVCTLVAFFILLWRGRGPIAPRTGVILATLAGIAIVVWRSVSNRNYLNDDFIAVSHPLGCRHRFVGTPRLPRPIWLVTGMAIAFSFRV